jgi:RNA polymerase sigma factor (sigma-70 family)
MRVSGGLERRSVRPSRTWADEDAAVAAARSGDEGAFTALVEPHRRELHVHCYRMLASFDQAEDVVQETLLRAWRNRARFEGRTTFRAWLYRIATNACLDVLRRSRRRATSGGAAGLPEITWLQPFPDRWSIGNWFTCCYRCAHDSQRTRGQRYARAAVGAEDAAGTSEFQAFRDEKLDPPALVCVVG